MVRNPTWRADAYLGRKLIPEAVPVSTLSNYSVTNGDTFRLSKFGGSLLLVDRTTWNDVSAKKGLEDLCTVVRHMTEARL